MKKYSKAQEVVSINSVKLGGQPGQWPTVMCGSIFYGGHKIVKDAATGDFDKAAAKELLDQEGQLAESFGIQRMPDVVGDTVEALTKYVDFVLEEIDGPLLVDSASVKTLLGTFQRYSGSEVMDRLVYSPIDLHTTDEQFAEIKKLGVKHALVLAFSPEAVMPEQKLAVLLGKDWQAGEQPDGLIAKTRGAGVENMMVDVGVIDFQGTAWSALSIDQVKEKIGLPAGCAPANALFSWQRTHKDTLQTKEQTAAAGAAVYTATTYMGADFVLYGPMRCCTWAYPAVAAADSLAAYGNRLNGIRPKTKSHPLYKLK